MSVQPLTQTPSTTASGLVPRHLGLILDGNRRWAKDRGLPTLEGHQQGWQTLKQVGLAALDRGVQYLSAYVFSTENWSRSKEEVEYLMDLLYWVATNQVEELHRRNVRIVAVGTNEGLSPKVQKALRAAEAKTAANTGGTLALCLNYGGQQEIADAVKKIVADGVKAETITPELIDKYLYHPEIPPADLVIRTSGEQRTSNFMLWRAAYAELMFVNKNWPDFNEDDLDAALAEYATRQRRYGQ